MSRYIALIFASVLAAFAAPLSQKELQAYFAEETEKLSATCLNEFKTVEEWEAAKPRLRKQLLEMLGLDPLPERSDLKPVIAGKVSRERVVVEKLHFQSMPGLYVTGNLYLPEQLEKPLPAILYLCGHAAVKTNGVSYGNKVAYQHHGVWFAKNGYACLILDTIQLGEIEGVHHGTYREGMWWNARGYTPAGVEAWNCVRALDYLETRPEVDKTRFGVTGRSGGGAYSWWITAIDDRIKAAAPVAGITDLHNHVVDGTVEGHCDCMFFVNTWRWDYPVVAALAAPRPLLFCNSDKDTIFPLDGVYRTQAKVRRIYDLYGAPKNFGLLITEGPHEDTQDLQLPVFRWFNRHLKGEDPKIEMAARKLFTGQELKVFEERPRDERTSRIHDSFVTITPVKDRNAIKEVLRERTFGGWPANAPSFSSSETTIDVEGEEVQAVEFSSQPHVRLKLFIKAGRTPSEIRLKVMNNDEAEAEPDFLKQFVRTAKEAPGTFNALLLTRGVGEKDAKRAIQVRRRYMLLGQTLDGLRVWDIARAVEFLRTRPGLSGLPLILAGGGGNAANALMYAAVAGHSPAALHLEPLPGNEKEAPDYLNYLRFTTFPDLVRLLRESGIEVSGAGQ